MAARDVAMNVDLEALMRGPSRDPVLYKVSPPPRQTCVSVVSSLYGRDDLAADCEGDEVCMWPPRKIAAAKATPLSTASHGEPVQGTRCDT